MHSSILNRKKVNNLLTVRDRHGMPRCVVLDPAEDLVFQGDGYRLYLAETPSGKGKCFLRLPETRLGNGDMQFEVEKLEFLEEASNKIEALYHEQKKDPNARVHYDWLIPRLEDSFITDESQDKRQANLISFVDAKVGDFFPLVQLMQKYKVDTKTTAWILGRFFKLQTFADDVDLCFNFWPDQVVIEPKMHRMVYLGWNLHEASHEWNNVARMARCMLDFTLAGDTPEDAGFMKNLELLATISDMSGMQAHRTLYTVIHKYWGRKYHPFTYYDLKTATWHSLTDAEIPNFMKGGN